jgi:hypothetical protein
LIFVETRSSPLHSLFTDINVTLCSHIYTIVYD